MQGQQQVVNVSVLVQASDTSTAEQQVKDRLSQWMDDQPKGDSDGTGPDYEGALIWFEISPSHKSHWGKGR